MSKVIKIKESAVLNLITKIITEEVGGEIKVTASSDLGTHPEFKGLKSLLAQLKTNVERALRGKTSYRIKTTSDMGTVVPKKQGNALVLEVTLIPCEEEKRHWFFDGSAAIYSYVNTTSFSETEGKVRTAAMEKATASFIGVQPQEAYPNHIGLGKFTGLNTLEPEKVYKLILKFVVGKRPGGFYDVEDEEPGVEKLANEPAANAVTKNDTTTNAAAVVQKNNTGSEKQSSGDTLKSVEEEWTSTNIDLAHAVKPFLTETQKGLEEMYKNGKNPTVENIVMTITKSPGGSYKTRVTADIVESTDGKAWVGIDSRGSAGKDYVVRADDQYLGGRYDKDGKPVMELDPDTKEMKQVNKGQAEKKADGTKNPCYGKSLMDCMKLPQIGGEDVKLAATIEDAKFPFKQYFVIFTKPKKFPPIK
jgi:hypothetical protein